jgi:uncharacterized protein YfaT (DUF1175 family)
VPELVAALRDAEGYVRWVAAEALGRIGPVTPDVVPALMAALGDATGIVRQAAAETLERVRSASP